MEDIYKTLGIIIIIILILKILDFLINAKPKQRSKKNSYHKTIGHASYAKKELLTSNEQFFYNDLKSVAKDLKLYVLAKIRLADLIDIVNSKNNREYYSLFGKIKSKHIDFALADEDLKIKLIIELDDKSHLKKSAIKRDKFKDEVLTKCGYKILRTTNSNDLKAKIQSILNLNAE